MYENPDGFLMADWEKRRIPPATLPMQERHKVYPPADPDKLAWCLEVIEHIDELIAQQKRMLAILRFNAKVIIRKLRVRLGDPQADRLNWEVLGFSSVPDTWAPPHTGTWKEARILHREWQDIDDQAAPVASRIFMLKLKRGRIKSIRDELESNINHWEGV